MAALIFQERLSAAAQPEHKLIRNAGSQALPQSHEEPVPKQSSRLDGYNVWPQTRTINVKSKNYRVLAKGTWPPLPRITKLFMDKTTEGMQAKAARPQGACGLKLLCRMLALTQPS